jgi:hypothetical protein
MVKFPILLVPVCRLEAEGMHAVSGLLQQDALLDNYMQILSLILRLRQVSTYSS